MSRTRLVSASLAGFAVLAVVTSAALGAGSRQVADLPYVQAQVKKFTALPTFTQPGPSFDASRAKGLTVFNIDSLSANPFYQAVESGMQQVAKRVGIKLVIYQNSGKPTEWVAGIQQAINQKANAIVLQGVNPKVVQPQLAAAKRAGIPVISGHTWDPAMPPAKGVTSNAYGPFTQAARVEADWAIADSKGSMNALVIGSNDFALGPYVTRAMVNEFKTRCGSTCKLTVVNVNGAEWPTKIQPTVQAALVKDPSINYVMAQFDAEVQWAIPAIIATGHKGKVKIVTSNGDTFALKDIQQKNVVAMDIGENLDWIGYAIMDQAMRAALHMRPAPHEINGLRIFDASNVKQAGVPPKQSKGYGTAWLKGYQRLWGFTK